MGPEIMFQIAKWIDRPEGQMHTEIKAKTISLRHHRGIMNGIYISVRKKPDDLDLHCLNNWIYQGSACMVRIK